MTTFFRADPSAAPNDLVLLPPAIRGHEDVLNVAATCEADVLARFTKNRADSSGTAYVLDANTAYTRYVWLAGYNPDPAQAAAPLVDALRREIAAVIRWRLATHAKKPLVQSESEPGNGRTARTYRADAEDRFPPDFGRTLKPFRLDGVPWVM